MKISADHSASTNKKDRVKSISIVIGRQCSPKFTCDFVADGVAPSDRVCDIEAPCSGTHVNTI